MPEGKGKKDNSKKDNSKKDNSKRSARPVLQPQSLSRLGAVLALLNATGLFFSPKKSHRKRGLAATGSVPPSDPLGCWHLLCGLRILTFSFYPKCTDRCEFGVKFLISLLSHYMILRICITLSGEIPHTLRAHWVGLQDQGGSKMQWQCAHDTGWH